MLQYLSNIETQFFLVLVLWFCSGKNSFPSYRKQLFQLQDSSCSYRSDSQASRMAIPTAGFALPSRDRYPNCRNSSPAAGTALQLQEKLLQLQKRLHSFKKKQLNPPARNSSPAVVNSIVSFRNNSLATSTTNQL